MDAAWKNALSLSLRQDLQQIKILMKEMGQLVKRHQEVNSWLFPNRPYSVSEDMDAGTYTQCLESVLDGVYVVLNILIVYINESIPSLAGKMPQRLTLGQSFEVLWNKVQEFVSGANKRSPRSQIPLGVSTKNKLCHVQKSSQTEDKTSPECDSCFVSLSCIKKVVNTLDEYADSTTKLARKNVRTHLFDTTLFGSMMQMCVSVEKDVENLIGNNKRLTSELAASSEKHNALKHEYKEMKKSTVDKEKYDQLQLEYVTRCNKICKLNKDILKMKHDKDKLSSKMVGFVLGQKKFVADLEGFKLYTDKVQNIMMMKLQMNDNSLNRIRNLVDTHRRQQWDLFRNMHALKETNKMLTKRISDSQINHLEIVGMRTAFENYIFHIEKFGIAITKKLHNRSEAVHRIEETVKTMGTAGMKLKYDKLHSSYNKERERRCKLEIKYYKSLEENKRLSCEKIPNGSVVKIKQMAGCVLQMLNERETSLLRGLDSRLDSIKLIESSIRRYTRISTVGVKGNPIEDMTRQIEANEAKMSSLKRENCNLLKTVNKLKLMNLPGVK